MGRSFKQLVAVLKSPYRIFKAFDDRHMLDWMPDEPYLKLAFRLKMGYKLDLKDPKTFNEKLQWLKLHDRDPLYTTLVDKYAVRAWVAERIGEEYLVPLVGGPWDSAEDIDFDALPEQFVLKCTHNSGGVIVCRDKGRLDIEETKDRLARDIKDNYYYSSREWPYKNVQPRIIAEKYMQDGYCENLSVYKLLCFGGEPRIFQTIKNDKTAYETIDYFDTGWERLDLRQNFPNSEKPMEKPEGAEKMLSLAKRLSRDFPQIRCDFYSVGGKIYFSELTFYSDSGLAAFDPAEWDGILGSWLELPNMEK